jgi:hypothetical protein
MEVLIVSRTRMRNGVCCGGLNLQNGEFVRLHNERGGNLSVDAPFQIGQVYNLNYQTAWNVRPRPHVEDKQIQPFYQLLRHLTTVELIHTIDRIVNVPSGDIDVLFDGMLNHSSYAAYVSPCNVPNHSVCFWRPNAPLYKLEFMGRVRYRFNNNNISYVGFQSPVNIIPAGTLLRMSLANWWSPDDITEKRCYLQLSGWFME